MGMTIYIYTLADPRTGNIRYVGKTHNLKKRLRQTLCDKLREKGIEFYNELFYSKAKGGQ